MIIGANYLGNGNCEFIVWANRPQKVSLTIAEPYQKILPMEKDEFSYWRVTSDNIQPGTKYLFRLNDQIDRPDPASHHQPYNVHLASEVVDHQAFNWDDNAWNGLPLEEYIIYELHTGTFTEEGTFYSAIEKLDYLADLGITAIEIMPVSQFPGDRNWGYDGCYPFAPQNSYGGPEGLKTLVNAAHQKGIAVVLDVVYNHFGPEGNYSNEYGKYLNSHYKTPWGDAINFDGPYSDEIRNYFLENAKHWLINYHIDGLRLDAIDTIYDLGAKHFLQELSEEIKTVSEITSRRKILIAESDLNDVKVIRPVEQYGYGIDAQWSDNFHHSLHSILTGELNGYYMDFGKPEHLVTSLREAFVYSGKYSSFRKRKHGISAAGMHPTKFVICLQNHDQVGNRAFGDRLSSLIPFEGLKLSAGIMFFSPYTPMLFMGEEYGEENPFLYFVSHTDENIVEAVQTGRKKEFKSFDWQDEIPDPFNENTFFQSKLNWNRIDEEKHRILLEFYRTLISLRKKLPALIHREPGSYKVSSAENEKVISIIREYEAEIFLGVFNLNNETVTTIIDFPPGNWSKILDSSSDKWLGSGESSGEEIIGKPQNLTLKHLSFVVYERKR